MKVIIVHIEVKPEFREDFIKETEFAQHKTLDEPGAIEYQICQDENDQNKFVLFEGYTDEAAYFKFTKAELQAIKQDKIERAQLRHNL